MDVKDGVIEEIRGLLARRNHGAPKAPSLAEQTALFAEGLALESLEVAELSAQLEARFGRDPFTDGETPQTVAEILDYYSRSSC